MLLDRAHLDGIMVRLDPILSWRGFIACRTTALSHTVKAQSATFGISITTKPMKSPSPDHPITIEPAKVRVVISVAGRVIADTQDALTLREATLPAALYIPRKDVDMRLLVRTDRATYCPYKGDCTYYSIPVGGERSANAVWSYEAPYTAVTAIKDYLAFYPDRVTIEQRSL